MSESETSLIFVYSADSGMVNSLKDIITRIIKPDAYACRLCGLTYDVFGMKSKWKKFIDNLRIPVEFLHRDEFLVKYKTDKLEFPSIYIQKGKHVELFISKNEINSTETLEALTNLVEAKVKEQILFSF